MTIQIRSRWTADVLFEAEANSLRHCLEVAVKKGADLHDAALLHAAIVRAFRWPCGAYFLPGVVTFGEHPASKN